MMTLSNHPAVDLLMEQGFDSEAELLQTAMQLESVKELVKNSEAAEAFRNAMWEGQIADLSVASPISDIGISAIQQDGFDLERHEVGESVELIWEPNR